MKHLATIVVLLGLAAGPAIAADFAPERRALFVSIVEAEGCRMHNFEPSAEIVRRIEKNGFTPDELHAIARDLFETGDAKRDGDELVLVKGACA